jgi:hypothetical protein
MRLDLHILGCHCAGRVVLPATLTYTVSVVITIYVFVISIARENSSVKSISTDAELPSPEILLVTTLD